MTAIRIVDYGIGNLHSVHRALSAWSDDVELVHDPAGIKTASHLVLPGVGAFGTAINEIRSRELEEPLHEFAASGKPMIGLCVGMQVLATSGLEGGRFVGLDLIPGDVVHLDIDGSSADARVPNMGWREVCPVSGPGGALFKESSPDDLYYFAHSYEFVPHAARDVVATTNFDGRTVTAAVKRENVWGLQFHPEKSAISGLRLLKSFVELD